LVAMKLAEPSSVEISLGVSIIARRSEWYRCGQICTEIMGNTYGYSEKQGK
jgi:hypothetical protein